MTWWLATPKVAPRGGMRKVTVSVMTLVITDNNSYPHSHNDNERLSVRETHVRVCVRLRVIVLLAKVRARPCVCLSLYVCDCFIQFQFYVKIIFVRKINSRVGYTIPMSEEDRVKSKLLLKWRMASTSDLSVTPSYCVSVCFLCIFLSDCICASLCVCVRVAVCMCVIQSGMIN